MIPPRGSRPLELWGGFECTVNRVGDRTIDQLERTGHARRTADLDRVAALGIRTLRYPLLWERIAPEGIERADWGWADERMARLRALRIRPIVGLLHHGSGPRDTHLLDAAFPEKLARYAGAVAGRYPWVDAYTPVNEPLTTARFSALYGFWYPHARDPRSFVRALLAQCVGTVRAMQEIRRVNPRARLVLTEDYGVTYSTPRLAYQAAYERHRRLLSMDLLCGRVGPGHPLWNELLDGGATLDELRLLARAPPPDVLGINYYITSDRMLDERLMGYPIWSHGGNSRVRYADVEAVRAWPAGIAGHEALLLDVGRRYQRPVALTEVHLGGEREQQLRWLREAWRGAERARRRVDVAAVTVWSLLGCYDWNSLVTRETGCYEPGVFDVTSGEPRSTALADAVGALSAGLRAAHPAATGAGWWRRRDRLVYGPTAVTRVRAAPLAALGGRRRVVIFGSGTLGRAFLRMCERRGLAARLLARGEVDVVDPGRVRAALRSHRAWAAVNATGYVRVDDAEADPERCHRENVRGAETLAVACADARLPLATFSSDLVFGGGAAREGAAPRPYLEADPVAPLNVYGDSKARGEDAVLSAHPKALVVRTSAFFGPWDEYNFVTLALSRLAGRSAFTAVEDVTVSPTYVPDLVNRCLDLLIDRASGVWHIANRGPVTWAELARLAARMAGLDEALVQARPLESFGLRAARPKFSALGSSRGLMLPTVDDALARYLGER